MMRQEESFGIVPLSYENGGWRVFLVQHYRGSTYWGFPKGHAEPGESPQQAALRELKEETNLGWVRWISTEPFVEQYSFSFEGKPIRKQVTYFAAEVSGTVALQPQEIQAGMWVSIAEARHQLTYPEGKSILLQVERALNAQKS